MSEPTTLNTLTTQDPADDSSNLTARPARLQARATRCAAPALEPRDTRHVLLSALLQDLQQAVAKCGEQHQSEHIHQARVAARRMRAVLRCMRTEMHPTRYSQLDFDLTNLGRALGDSRAADIRIQQLAQLLERCMGGTQIERRALRRAANLIATQARSRLQQQLRASAWGDRMQRLATAIAQDELLLLPARTDSSTYRALLRDCLNETAHALRRKRRNIDALHRQRIRIKRARYVSELLMPYVALDLERTITALDRSQDLLGELHDLHALDEWLESATTGGLAKRLSTLATRRAAKCTKHYQRLQPKLRHRLQITARALRREFATRPKG